MGTSLDEHMLPMFIAIDALEQWQAPTVTKWIGPAPAI
jgi:hypothetical protein